MPAQFYHPALEGTLVLLPGLGDIYGKDNELHVLPAVHKVDEDYPYTNVIPNEHVHVSDKYASISSLPGITLSCLNAIL